MKQIGSPSTHIHCGCPDLQSGGGVISAGELHESEPEHLLRIVFSLGNGDLLDAPEVDKSLLQTFFVDLEGKIPDDEAILPGVGEQRRRLRFRSQLQLHS